LWQKSQKPFYLIWYVLFIITNINNFNLFSRKAIFSLKKISFRGTKPLKSKTEHVNDSNFAEFSFEKSPIMSTYLLAFVIGNYDFIEQINSRGVVVRVYTPIGKSYMGEYSLQVILI
jgi:hypothetical protein